MLPKLRRLSRRDLNVCNNTGKTLRFPHFLIRYLANNLKFSRFGVVTSTKLSKSAVVRNKLRRQTYNSLSTWPLAPSTDVLFFPQKSMLNLGHEEIGSLVNKALSEIAKQSTYLLQVSAPLQ